MPMTSAESLKVINDFRSLVAYLRDELEWEIPEDLSYDQLTYSYTADELGLKLDAQVEITQLRPILGQQNPWGVFFVDFDRAELPVTLLRRILSSVSRRKRESANAGDRAMFGKNDLLFVSAFGKADERRLALAHFHEESGTAALPTLRVLAWDRHDTQRHMDTVVERLARLRWPGRNELPEVWKSRWSNAFIDRPRAAISTSRDLAAALATCAKQIREAIQEILPKERPGQPLSLLFEAVKATLNKDLDVAKFADTYAQTVAYGLLSKRIDQIQRWRAEKKRTLNGDLPRPMITVDALETAIPTNPFLSELLNSFLAAGGRDNAGAKLDFDELGLGDVVDLLNTANMEAVLDDFDKDKQGDDPVIHFYEGFLAAYDKAMKVQRGVFYTPKPVVSFIVRSVDEVLRTEFGLPLGLADTTTWGQFVAAHPETEIPEGAKADDPFVNVLDPATGTGTFLVEVIDLIHHRMMDEAWKGKPAAEKSALWNAYVAEHLLSRLYGYELMMAPYAVAHMKIGLKLADTGYDFSGTETGSDGNPRPTRARVFLTNSLEPAQDLDLQLAFMNEALAHEARAANDAKARARFTVVVGNPPYSRVSKNKGPYARSLVQPFKDAVPEEANQQPLEDDYLKFLAFAFRTEARLICLINNHNFLDGVLFKGARHWFMERTNLALICDLNGNSNTGEKPEGIEDQNVFEITPGVSVNLFASIPGGSVRRRYLSVWGRRGEKFDKLATLDIGSGSNIKPCEPDWLLTDDIQSRDSDFDSFVRVPDVFIQHSTGVMTVRDSLAIGFDRQELIDRFERFRNPSVSDSEFPAKAYRSWSVGKARKAVRSDANWKTRIVNIHYRPLDFRVVYYSSDIVTYPNYRIMENVSLDHLALMTTRLNKGEKHAHELVTGIMPEIISLSSKSSNNAYVFPLYTRAIQTGSVDKPNLSSAFTKRLAKLAHLRFDDGSGAPAQGMLPRTEPPPPPQRSLTLRHERGDLKTTFGARDVFDWIYAVLHSPTYRERYADFLKSDFPRVPLPNDRDLFAELTPLGTKMVALHLLDADALPDLLDDPKVRFVSNGGEPRLGRFNKEVRRDVSGRVYLNDQNWFATVPQAAWERWIGGYQPAQKWLKDRSQTGSKDKLKTGRLLTDEDILHYRRMIVALEETGKVMAEIDEVVARHGGWPDAFKGMKD